MNDLEWLLSDRWDVVMWLYYTQCSVAGPACSKEGNCEDDDDEEAVLVNEYLLLTVNFVKLRAKK